MKKLKQSSTIEMSPLMKKPPGVKAKDELIEMWLNKDFEGFCCTLEKHKFDLERKYEEHENCRILELVVKSAGNEDYLKCLIDAGASVNQISDATGSAALHYAAEVGNAVATKVLLEANADPNQQDRNGDTPLHKLAFQWDSSKPRFEETLQLLLARPDIAVNVPNLKGLTPIYIAAAQDEEIVVAELLRLGNSLDLDSFQCTAENKTAREMILKHFSGLESELPKEWEPDPSRGEKDYKYRLFYYLLTDKETKFCQVLREASITNLNMKSLLSSFDGQRYTYLQYAAKKGYVKAGRKLIQYGADVNLTWPGTETPITLAATGGKSIDLLNLFLSNKEINLQPDETGETILHKAIKSSEDNYAHYSILRKLVRHPSINVNAKDSMGRTPLHIAVTIANEKNIFLLLDNGAKLDMSNNYGEIPLKQISRSTLKKYLDSKITTNDLLPKQKEFAYTFNYKFFTSNNNNEHIYGVCTDLLVKIRDTVELRDLISHPIYATIILYKWYRIRLYFYLDLFFYTLFCLFLTCSIFFSPVIKTSNCNSTNSSSFEQHISCYNQYYFTVTQSFVFVFSTVLTISEVFQCISSPCQYFKSIENWIQISVVISTFALLGSDCLEDSENSMCKELSAIAIFFAWFEFFFVIGQHPKTTSYIDMFRTASLFLLQFLAVHTCLILAFVFSFHILFSDSESFSTIPSSFFKTVVMITGEFEVLDIPLNNSPFTSHLLFAAFIFLVAIVLFNLLIGLAVSATKPIEEDAFLYSCLAQVSIISFFENIFFNDTNYLYIKFKKILKCKNVKTTNKSHSILVVYPNQNNRMEIHQVYEEGEDTIVQIKHHLSEKILNDAQRIINLKLDEENAKCDKFVEIQHQIESTKASLEEELKIVKAALTEVLEKIEKKHSTDELDGSLIKCKKSELVKKKLKQLQFKYSRNSKE